LTNPFPHFYVIDSVDQSLPSFLYISDLNIAVILLVGRQTINNEYFWHGVYAFYYYRKILLDTSDPSLPEYIKNLQNALSQHKCGIQEIVISHWHADHCGSVPDVCKEITKCNYKKLRWVKRID
jgi:metal-dependent hydrolase (beta-lactamase superfamily II)